MAKKEKLQKSNAMRELDRAGIPYEAQEVVEDDISRGVGVRIAEQLGEDPDAAFKTLVCVAPSGDHVVCCIPVACELDLKRAAAAAGEKSLSLMPIKGLEAVTGYVRGGCTPIGMKKLFPTLFDETAQLFDAIGISGGRRGLSLRVAPEPLAELLGAKFVDIAR
ncbi:aminoacyl-tRNA deacylase [Paratractidigestivibacter sp.]|uniref:aminoacyl-tRNA deacylase n=1 Tax=Paratractidigestivibacter sp. TaxID=2847316 RepID=UPI002AC936BA|nr:aminoacyl-tRNA deacylase [Paratractidigestivibacter sp.]